MRDRHILATSGGMLPTERGRNVWRLGGLIRHALALSGARRPKICFVGTAGGDDPSAIAARYGACAGEDVEPSHLTLFPMPNLDDIRRHVLAQDVVWVGGGSVVNLLAVWRTHGLDDVMREAWECGVVLGGASAGSICWHVGGTTDSYGPELRPVTNGLAFLPYGNGVHNDSNEQRRPLLHELVATGELPRSYATDDGAGLHYVGTYLHEAVCEIEGSQAWQVDPDSAGGAVEVGLPTRLLAG